MGVFILVWLLLGHDSSPARSPVSQTRQITIRDYAFMPERLTIPAGTTVVWINRDSTAHTVTSTTSAWPDAGPLDPGHRFRQTFRRPGTYRYLCTIHPTMTALVIVTPR